MPIESRFPELSDAEKTGLETIEVSMTVKDDLSDAARTDMLDTRADRMAKADKREVVGAGAVTLKGNVLARTFYTTVAKSG